MSLMMTMMMTMWMKTTENSMTKMKVLQWQSHQTQNFPIDAFVDSDCPSVDSAAVLVDSVPDLAASVDVDLDVDVVDEIENLVSCDQL